LNAAKATVADGLIHSLDGIFRQRYIDAMKWEVEYTDEFGQWWSGLSEQEQISVAASVQLLEERGPSLGFPHCSGINGSKHGHMRELRTWNNFERKERPMAKKFSDLRAQMKPEARQSAEAAAQTMLAAMPLNELRQARGLSQKMLAEVLHVQQPSIAKIEKRTDMYLSTLRSHIEAMGGELEIVARFPDGSVRISNFADLGNAAPV
jgi:hypothetical protein